jgi:hypothetical protein
MYHQGNNNKNNIEKQRAFFSTKTKEAREKDTAAQAYSAITWAMCTPFESLL